MSAHDYKVVESAKQTIVEQVSAKIDATWEREHWVREEIQNTRKTDRSVESKILAKQILRCESCLRKQMECPSR